MCQMVYSVNHHMTPTARPVNAAAYIATRNSPTSPFTNPSKIVVGRNLNRYKTVSGFWRRNYVNYSFFFFQKYLVVHFNFLFLMKRIFEGLETTTRTPGKKKVPGVSDGACTSGCVSLVYGVDFGLRKECLNSLLSIRATACHRA